MGGMTEITLKLLLSASSPKETTNIKNRNEKTKQIKVIKVIFKTYYQGLVFKTIERIPIVLTLNKSYHA